jgi:DNA primase
MTILEIAKRHVDLRHAGGAEWLGLCPFHEERTPSFRVNDEKGTWFCHGCGQGGGTLNLAQKLGEVTPALAMSKLYGERTRQKRSGPRGEQVLHPSGIWMIETEALRANWTPGWYRKDLQKLVRECFSRREESHAPA